MRLLLLASLFLAAAAPAQRPAPASTAVVLASDTEARWVAFDLTPGNQIRFQMTLNGRPATAILDTGVSFTVASSVFARDAGLKIGASASAQAIGGNVTVSWAAVEQIAFGGLTRRGGRVAVTELKAVATGSATPVDVLLGADLLRTTALEIDYDARRFRLLPSGRMPFPGTSVPLGLARASGVYTSEVTLGVRRLRPLIVDTGDGSGVTLARDAWVAARQPALRTTTALAYGLGGELVTDLVVVPQLRLGPLVARNVEVRVERSNSFSTATLTAGRIGSALLQRYRVLMDPTAGRMILAPGRLADRPPLKSTSGLLVAIGSGELRVLHVMRGSPAEGTGWRAGDRICSVDGSKIPADYATSPIGGWTADTPGRVVSVGLCDRSTRTLTLAEFY